MVFVIFCALAISISLLWFDVIFLCVLSFSLVFLEFFSSTIARPVRAFSVRGSVLLLFKVWLMGRPQAATASYHGKAPVVNALTLSCVWYVASLIYVPRRVGTELNTFIFKTILNNILSYFMLNRWYWFLHIIVC